MFGRIFKTMSEEKKLVVVAGATGHIGQLVVAELRSEEYSVRALVRRRSKPEAVQSLEKAGADVRAQSRGLTDVLDTNLCTPCGAASHESLSCSSSLNVIQEHGHSDNNWWSAPTFMFSYVVKECIHKRDTIIQARGNQKIWISLI